MSHLFKYALAPDVQIKTLADRLESGDVPSIGEMVSELRNIARRMNFLESILERHVAVPLTPSELARAKEASMPGSDTPNLNRMIEDSKKRTAGCQCQWEEGDSPCKVHGD